YPRFCVSQARVFVVLGGSSRYCVYRRVVFVVLWWYLVEVGVEVELYSVEVVLLASVRLPCVGSLPVRLVAKAMVC
ncbi:hypothetical protein Taro_014113, partial [Colocasia esculenta]|nr:hypothetical protein [Colocasia esculenta]